MGGRDVAQLLERRTGTPLRQVRFPGAARDFSPRVNSQCRLSYGVCTPPSATVYWHGQECPLFDVDGTTVKVCRWKYWHLVYVFRPTCLLAGVPFNFLITED